MSRIEYLGRLFPDARFIIPARDPVRHIASLIKQHRLFCEEESRNAKVLAYMQRAGHFGFGHDLRPINFGDPEAVMRIRNLWASGEEISGWAAYWASAYSFIADLLEKNKTLARRMLLVHYDDFCETSAETLWRVYRHCKLEVEDRVIEEQSARISAPTYYKPEFSKAEIGAIEQETGQCMERIQRFIGHRGDL